MIIPISLATYRRGDLPPVRLVNCYAEASDNEPSKVVLFQRPGMSAIATLTSEGVQGLFQQPGFLFGDRFAVSGTTLFRNEAAVGTIPLTGPAQIVSADALLIARAGQLSRYDGNTTTAVAFPDGASVSATAYLGGYAIAARQGTRRFYFTTDSTTWDGLDYLSTEQSTDPIVGIAVVVDQLWVFCERHTEIFFLTGDPDAPFQRVQGRVFDKGAWSRDAIVKLDNTVMWLGSDGIVYRAENAPIRVSNHGIEEQVSLTVNASAFSYVWKGHLFYVLRLDQVTLVYDVATQLWHSVQSADADVWLVSGAIQDGADVIVGGSVEGKLYRLSDTVYADAGQIIPRIFTVLITERVILDNLYIDCSVNELPSSDSAPGLIELRTSRDSGTTWTDWQQRSLGENGRQRRQSIRYSRLGIVDRDGMVIQVRVTDRVVSRVSNVRVNETGGGRSRR